MCSAHSWDLGMLSEMLQIEYRGGALPCKAPGTVSAAETTLHPMKSGTASRCWD